MWWNIFWIGIAVISVGVLMAYRHQIKSLRRQLEYITNHDTNMRLTTDIDFKEVDQLVLALNEMIDRNDKLRITYQHQDEELRDIVMNLSHDIRTPLTSLDGYFQLLVETESAIERARYSEVIQGRIKSLSELLEQLFMYMKVQNGAYEVSIEPLQMNRILYDVILSYYEEFTSKNIEPKIHIPEQIIVARVNKAAFERVLHNIIKNALEHGRTFWEFLLEEDREDIIIRCRNEYGEENPLIVHELFNRFYKANTARTNTSTGLGLSIAKTLVEKMEGTIGANIIKEDDKNILEIWIRLKK